MRAAYRMVLLGRFQVLSECTSIERSVGSHALSIHYDQYALIKTKRSGCFVKTRDECSIYNSQELEPLKACENDHF